MKNIQAHLRQAKSDTTANEYMQKLPLSSVQRWSARCKRRLNEAISFHRRLLR